MRYHVVAGLAGLVVLFAFGQAARSADERARAQGQITRVRPGDNQVVVKTADGRDLKLQTDDRSVLRARHSRVALDQFKEGDRVRVVYTSQDGSNRVVRMVRVPANAEDVRREARAALEAARSYTFQQKEAYQERLESVLDDLHDRIDQLNERAKGQGREASRELNERVQELRKQEGVVRRQLDRVKSASADSWDEIKKGAAAALQDLQTGLERAIDRFKR
jgi:hypothetical protein